VGGCVLICHTLFFSLILRETSTGKNRVSGASFFSPSVLFDVGQGMRSCVLLRLLVLSLSLSLSLRDGRGFVVSWKPWMLWGVCLEFDASRLSMGDYRVGGDHERPWILYLAAILWGLVSLASFLTSCSRITKPAASWIPLQILHLVLVVAFVVLMVLCGNPVPLLKDPAQAWTKILTL